MQESKKFAFDVGITLIASIIGMILGFVLSIILGRYFGAKNLGIYNMVSIIYSFAVIFSGIGISSSIIKFAAETKNDRGKFNIIVSSGIITSLFLGIGFSVLFYFTSDIFEGIFKMQGLSGLLKILSPVFPFSLISLVLFGMLNGIREMKKSGIAAIVQSVSMIVVSLFLLYRGFGISGLVIGTVLSSVVSCIYLIWITRHYFELELKGYVQTTKKMLLFGTQIFGANLLNAINYQADMIIVGYFLTATDLGYYGVAVALSKFFWILPQAIQKITYPATSEYLKMKNYTALQIMIDKSMKYTACILSPIALGIGFFGEKIITGLYRMDFNFSVLPLLILVIGTVIYGVIISIGSTITGAGRPDLGLKAIIISTTSNIVLNVLLIPSFGIIGAAIATTVTYVAYSLVTIYIIIKILKVNIDFYWFAKLFGTTILLFLLLQYLNIFLVTISIMFIYVLIIYQFFLTKEDRIFCMQLLRTVLRYDT